MKYRVSIEFPHQQDIYVRHCEVPKRLVDILNKDALVDFILADILDSELFVQALEASPARTKCRITYAVHLLYEGEIKLDFEPVWKVLD